MLDYGLTHWLSFAGTVFIILLTPRPDMANVVMRSLSSGVRGGLTSLGGMCAGARAGLFAGAAHTSNDRDFLIQNAPGYAGTGNYLDSPTAIVDNRVISSPDIAPVSFTAAVYEAAKLEPETVDQFRAMMAAESQA